MPFFLPQRPMEANPRNSILEGINQATNTLGEAFQKRQQKNQQSKLLEALNNAKTPEDLHRSITQILGSGLFSDKSKEMIQKQAYTPQDYAPGYEAQGSANEGADALPMGLDEDDFKIVLKGKPKEKKLTDSQLAINPDLARIEKEKLQGEHAQFSHESNDYARNQKWIDPIFDASSKANRMEATLDELEKLNETGDINSPFIAQMAEEHPYLKGFLSADSQEYNSAVNSLVSDMIKKFGRVMAREFPIVMSQLATLSNTQQGRRQILSRLRQANEFNKLGQDILVKLQKENEGVPLGKLQFKYNELLDKAERNLIEQWREKDEMVSMIDPETGEEKKYPRWVLEDNQ
jgi:hypothetical protein